MADLRTLVLALACILSVFVAGTPGQCDAKLNPACKRDTGKGPREGAEQVSLILEHLVLDRYREQWRKAWSSGVLQQRVEASMKKYNISAPPSDMVGQLCRVTAFFKEAGEAYVLATDENIEAYMKACREVYPTMVPEVRKHVEALWRKGELQKSLVGRQQPYAPTTSEACGAFWRDKTDEELLAEFGADAEPYFREGARPKKERTIALSEIAEAFRRGEVARFDARGLLPAEVLNVTLRDLRDLHAGTAREIPVNSGIFHGHWERCHAPLERLPDFIQKFGLRHEVMALVIRGFLPWLLEKHCNTSHNLDDVAHWASANLKVPFDLYYDQPEEVKATWRNLSESFRVLGPAAINLRRLPKFAGDLDFVRAVGLEGTAYRSHNFLWLSVSRGQFHADVYDNMFMQLTEVVDLQAFPPNCSRLLDERPTTSNQGTFTLLRQRVPPGKTCAPLFHMRLHPGEGAVIPSGAYHKVIAWRDGRISMNAFFEPRFGHMAWKGNTANFYLRENPGVLAARSFWLKAAENLWRTQKVSMFYHTSRMEVI